MGSLPLLGAFLSHLTWELCGIYLRNTTCDDYITQQQSQKYFPSFIYFLQCGISLINSWHLCFSVSYCLGRCYSDVLICPLCWVTFILTFLGRYLLELNHSTWNSLKHPYPGYILWVHNLAWLPGWLQAKSTRCVSEWESLQTVTLSYWITQVSLSEAKNHRVEST